MLAVLRQRNYSLLWFAGLVSITGDWTLNVALPFHVYQSTGSALATGLMFMTRTLPGVLFGGLAGVFSDRWNRKWTMVIVNLVAAILVLLLFAATSAARLWIVYVVAFIESSIMQFFTPAEKALLPRLVAEPHLATANALSALNGGLGMLVGPAIGGLLMGSAGLAGVLIFDSASYLIAGAMIFLITWSPDIPVKRRDSANAFRSIVGVWKDGWDGLDRVKKSRPVSAVFIAVIIAMLGEGIIQALLVLLVKLLRGGAVEFGWLLTFRGLGGLLGGVIFGRIGASVPPHRLFPWTLVGMGSLFLVIVNHPVLWPALILLCLVGICAVGANVTSTTMMQKDVSNDYLGRIFGLLGMVSALMILVGQGSASVLADRWGVVVLLNIGGGLYILSGLIPFLMLRKYSGLVHDHANSGKTKSVP
jgi:MFS family permease